MSSYLEKTIVHLEKNIEQYGITQYSIFVTFFFLASSFLYGYFYVLECGFNPAIYYSFSDYIDAFALNALSILIMIFVYLILYDRLLLEIPWTSIPILTKLSESKCHAILTIFLAFIAFFYLQREMSHLTNKTLSTTVITFLLFVSANLTLLWNNKVISKMFFLSFIIILASISTGLSDANKIKKAPEQYTIEYTDGEKEPVGLLATSSKYILCQSTVLPAKKKAIQTRYIRAITPMNKKVIEHRLIIPPTPSRTGKLHDPK